MEIVESIFQYAFMGTYLVLSTLAVIGGFQHDLRDQKRAKLARLKAVK